MSSPLTNRLPLTSRCTDKVVSDEELLHQLQCGDAYAFESLYCRYRRLVYSVCIHILRDSAEADDVVHDIFLSLFWKCVSFDPAKGAARSWIIQVAYSVCFDHRAYLRARHGQSRGTGETAAFPTDILSQEGKSVSIPDELSLLWNASIGDAFNSLSWEQQRALGLRYFNGDTFKEIGEKMGISDGNAKHYVYRGIDRLRSIFLGPTREHSSEKSRQEILSELEEVV